MDHTFLTYDDAATRLGIKADSVRRRARARKWPRRSGNDGLALVGVPNELLIADNAPDDTPDHPPGPPPGAPADVRIAELNVEVKLLRDQLEDLRADRDAWRAQAERLASESRPIGLFAKIFGRR